MSDEDRPDEETIELELVPAESFADRDAVQDFVRSEKFDDLSRIVGYALYSEAPLLSPEEDANARGVARVLLRDLTTLAMAAVGSPDCPLIVTQEHAGSRVRDVCDLGAIGRAMSLSEGFDVSVHVHRTLYDLINHYQRQVVEEDEAPRPRVSEPQAEAAA